MKEKAKKSNVLFIGSLYWCNYLKKLFDENTAMATFTTKEIMNWLFLTNKKICLVGVGYPDIWKRKVIYLFVNILFALKVINFKAIYWIGSDVKKLKKGSKNISKFFNFAGSPWLADEVKLLGYECESRFFPIKLEVDKKYEWPKQKKLTILCYLPNTNYLMHGSDEIIFLAKKNPYIEFIIVGSNGSWCKEKIQNISFTGWVDDIDKYILKAHILLRRTKHDSFSAFVREGIISGRYVIFTYDVPGVLYVKSNDIEKLQIEIRKLYIQFKNNSLNKIKIDKKVKNDLLDVNRHLEIISKDFNRLS